MDADKTSVFLTAEWRYLAMLNYEIDPALLAPLVPAHTELDFWDGRTFVSLVGFLFLETRICGIPIPFHRKFEEVNLRFYVRRRAEDGWRRGVAFIKELVPRAAIAFAARKIYNENYAAVPMCHHIEKIKHEVREVTYTWQFKGKTGFLKAAIEGRPSAMQQNSIEKFIAEHYWGYARQRDGTTMEYQVEHPPWQTWNAKSAEVQCDVAELYGERFVDPLRCPAASAFVAEGSAVRVRKGLGLNP